MILFVLRFLCLLFAFAEPVKNPTVFVGISADFSMPLVSYSEPLSNPKIQGGIFKEQSAAICKELQVTPTWILLPKLRLGEETIAGKIDFYCHANQAWWKVYPTDSVLWSKELYPSRNYLVALSGSHKSAKAIGDFKGENVGTLSNFFYVGLDEAFQQKHLFRDDAADSENNVQKLLHHRVDYIILADMEFEYYQRKYPALEKMDFPMPPIGLRCVLSKKSKITLEDLNKAIDKLKKSGEFQRILSSAQAPQ